MNLVEIVNQNGITLGALIKALKDKNILTDEEIQATYNIEVEKFNAPKLTVLKKPALLVPETIKEA